VAMDGIELRPQVAYGRSGPLCPIGAGFVWLEPDYEKRLVRGGDIVDEIEPNYGQHTLDPWDGLDDVFDLFDDRLGAVDRSTLRQSERREDGTLVLLRQKALRRFAKQQHRRCTHTTHPEDSDQRHVGD